MNFYYKILEDNQIIGYVMSDKEMTEYKFVEIEKEEYNESNEKDR